ncbi:MAG: hypothetical protein ACRCYR_06505 [Phycicoccus sp.]
MNTTVVIPDALMEEARLLGRQQGATLRDFIVSGLRSEIDRRRSAAQVVFHLPTVDGRGLVAGLEPADAAAASYGSADRTGPFRTGR